MGLRRLTAAIHPRLAVVLHDLAMVWLAWTAVNWLRYSFEANPPSAWQLAPDTAIVLLVQGTVLWWTGLYKGLWRFASLPGSFRRSGRRWRFCLRGECQEAGVSPPRCRVPR